jgi:Zinc-finger double-stranded RNA-binding
MGSASPLAGRKRIRYDDDPDIRNQQIQERVAKEAAEAKQAAGIAGPSRLPVQPDHPSHAWNMFTPQPNHHTLATQVAPYPVQHTLIPNPLHDATKLPELTTKPGHECGHPLANGEICQKWMSPDANMKSHLNSKKHKGVLPLYVCLRHHLEFKAHM